MFKKRCTKCEKKIARDFDFCPYCGNSIDISKDYGLLGKNDNLEELRERITPKENIGGFTGNIIEKMLGNAFRVLEKEIRNLNEQENRIEKMENNAQRTPPIPGNFQLFINGKRVNMPQFQDQMQKENKPKTKNEKMPQISEETLKNSTKLPRKEAKARVTRHKEKLIYELDTPGLETVDKVLINKLENSIEIKAYTPKTVYYKTLPVKLPLMQYSINPQEGKLFLEFKT
jgi:hypothetical protein